MKTPTIVSVLLLVFVSLYTQLSFASDVSVCFTPGEDCTQKIVDIIDHTQKILLIQAYQFTSQPIAKAVVMAKHRGVTVQIILDKSQYRIDKYNPAIFFDNQNMPVWIDYKPAIAHNKVMISDDEKVITGSFNFTKSAQLRNAENLLIVNNSDLARKYTQNFKNRLAVSVDLNSYKKMKEN